MIFNLDINHVLNWLNDLTCSFALLNEIKSNMIRLRKRLTSKNVKNSKNEDFDDFCSNIKKK